MQYRTVQDETGTIVLTYWTPMSGQMTSLPPEQRALIGLPPGAIELGKSLADFQWVADRVPGAFGGGVGPERS
jgi:hypothetical protein